MTATSHDENVSMRCIFAFLLFLMSAPTVSAATPTWLGPYMGAYLGGSLGNNYAYTNVGTVTDTSYFTTSTDIEAVDNAGILTRHPYSGLIGIQAGQNWAWKQVIYGLAVDYSLLPLSSSQNFNANYPDNSDTYSVYTSMSTNWLCTLRGRLGYQAMLHWPSLLYVTGGMAVTQLKVSNSFSDSSSYAGAGGSTTYQNKLGWTAGAGVELAFVDHASVNLEYLFVYVPAVNTTGSISNSVGGFGVPTQSLSSSFSTTGRFRTSLVKVGLNYWFD